jgi:hypothetical protein
VSDRHQEELRIVAARAAAEAAARERHRCLWILDRLVQQCAKDVDSKILPAAELQLVKVRFELTKTIAQAARALILSGVRPPLATLTPVPPAPTEKS